MWGYKTSSISSASFSSDEECRAVVAKCSETFIALGLLRESDFERLQSAMSENPTHAVGVRIRRGKELMTGVGVPNTVIFSTPNYLFVAPKLGGLLARLSQMDAGRLPAELRNLHAHLSKNRAALENPAYVPKVLYHVSQDGTRTAITSTLSIEEQRRRRRADERAPAPAPSPVERRSAGEKAKPDSAMAIALQAALKRKPSDK
jgi:hypothetical protein